MLAKKLFGKEVEALRKTGTLIEKMETLRNILDEFKTFLSQNGLLDFVLYYPILSRFTNPKESEEYIAGIRTLHKGLGNHKYDSWSDERLLKREQMYYSLNDYQEKKRQFEELMSIDVQVHRNLNNAGFGDDAILDALYDLDRLSPLFSIFEGFFRSLEEM
ncbi:hypothetical protein D4R87_02650 [bacterium]|nr:MAG: hypothetical protein D4R87_02650 [bacterium]